MDIYFLFQHSSLFSFFLFIFPENSEKYICLFSKYPLYLKYIFHSSLFTKDVPVLFQAFFVFIVLY